MFNELDLKCSQSVENVAAVPLILADCALWKHQAVRTAVRPCCAEHAGAGTAAADVWINHSAVPSGVDCVL